MSDTALSVRLLVFLVHMVLGLTAIVLLAVWTVIVWIGLVRLLGA